jgi:3-methyladenine DNA glycosylase/8-oxoguanine DNA glycosylase
MSQRFVKLRFIYASGAKHLLRRRRLQVLHHLSEQEKRWRPKTDEDRKPFRPCLRPPIIDGRRPTPERNRGQRRKLLIETVAGSVVPQLTQTVAHMFRLDEDLSRFYELVREDELAWCTQGAGPMLRAPTVFEDVVKSN